MLGKGAKETKISSSYFLSKSVCVCTYIGSTDIGLSFPHYFPKQVICLTLKVTALVRLVGHPVSPSQFWGYRWVAPHSIMGIHTARHVSAANP